MIKLDIINEVVNKTGITKTKAEMAVETVFESMSGRWPRATASNCAALACSTYVRARPASDATRAPAPKCHSAGKAVRFKPGKELQSID